MSDIQGVRRLWRQSSTVRYSIGLAICKPRQGLWNLSSVSTQLNDFSLSCNDGLHCQAKLGKGTQCVQGMSKAQSDKAKADKELLDAALREANPKVCLQRGSTLKKGYDLRCHDNQYKTAIFLWLHNILTNALKTVNILYSLSIQPCLVR